jgi:hypothetical protein
MAIRSLRTYLVVIYLSFSALTSQSQFVLIPETQASGVVMRQQIWSLMINNLSGGAKNAILFITVTDRLSSQVLLQANSNILILNPGVKRVTYNELVPLQFAVSTVGFPADRQLSQPLPVGEYLICYRLYDSEGKKLLLGSECVRIIAEPLSPPQLIQPENKTTVMTPRPVLTWTPPSPVHMFTALSYDIIVSPLYEKQSPEEALQRNIPVMTTTSMNNSVLYPSTYTNLDAGKTYAWQVLARDAGRSGGKSEVWTFTVMPDSVVSIVSNATYVKLSRENKEVAIVHQGILKAEYYNFFNDSTVNVSVRRASESNARGKMATNFTWKVKPGQNFLEHNLNGRLRLEADVVYEVIVINSRKEEWAMQFMPRNYF